MMNVVSDLESTSLQKLAHAIYENFPAAVKMNVLVEIVDICNIFAETLIVGTHCKHRFRYYIYKWGLKWYTLHGKVILIIK